ncbi:MAG: hypothetical protein ACLUD2_08675 [Clostridium sp.]
MLLKAPYHYLYSAILMICFLRCLLRIYLDVQCLPGTGIRCRWYLMEFFKMPGTPLMLAFILGSKIESYFRMGCSYARGRYDFFRNPSDFSDLHLIAALQCGWTDHHKNVEETESSSKLSMRCENRK